MRMSVIFTVPLVPPDLNHYVRHTRTGKHYVTKESLAFKQAVGVYARGEFVQAKSFSVRIIVVLGKGKKGDIDGFQKLVLDGLADVGVFRDLKGEVLSDAYVDDLHSKRDRKERPDQGRTIITVEALT
jgi:crossover junction endodeoxyribonuclease RusA